MLLICNPSGGSDLSLLGAGCCSAMTGRSGAQRRWGPGAAPGARGPLHAGGCLMSHLLGVGRHVGWGPIQPRGGGLAWLTSWSGPRSHPESWQALTSIPLLSGAVKELGQISPFSFRNDGVQPLSLLRAGPWSHCISQRQFGSFAGGKFGYCKSKGDFFDPTGKVQIILIL